MARDEPAGPPSRWMSLLRTAWRIVTAIAPLAFLGLAVWALTREFSHLDPIRVRAAIATWTPPRLAGALAASAGSFLLIAIVEWRAMRWLNAHVAFPEVLRISTIANGLAHSLGAAILVGAALRVRLYARHHVDLTTIAASTVYQTASFVLGLGGLAGLSLALAAEQPALRGVGWLMLAGVAAYLVACATLRRPLTLWNRTLSLPPLGDGIFQLVLGVVDNILAIAILWLLLPGGGVGYWSFVSAYISAYVVGSASGVPAGAGLFEAGMAKLLPQLDRPELAAAFLGFRLLFYLLPLAVAAILLGLETLRGGIDRPAPSDGAV